MVRNVVTIQMEGIEAERNVGVRTAAVNLLVHIAITQKSSVVPDILNMLEKVSISFITCCFNAVGVCFSLTICSSLAKCLYEIFVFDNNSLG